MNRWEVAQAPLDEDNIAETLAVKLYSIEFENEAGDSVYPVAIERSSNSSIAITMSDETKFELVCNKL